MTSQRPPSAPEPETPSARGRTTISVRALQGLAVGLARDAAHVPHRDVSVALSDERGALKVSVTVPVALSAGPRESLLDSGAGLRRDLIDGMRELSGRIVENVDVRYRGVRRIAERRAR